MVMGQGRDVPALHSGLQQDYMLKGLPALSSSIPVRLKSCRETRQ